MLMKKRHLKNIVHCDIRHTDELKIYAVNVSKYKVK